ncbi:similar to SPPL2b; presenilin-like protein 1, isoform CRA_c [Rattus norvegicus]|uniref:Similar to SPPL2b; presenilin-like protein 1, isoform CRA_c n=1 Tax=Rattus norvegicus TaxID=10116 RepID=A6K8E5_RAT|nr:similar to SPPL2b; presenilin-like protein 1, isoform CRA_c [Rattus norvegicus]
MAAARLAASLLLLAAQVACEFGVLRVVPQSGGTRGRDYCILYNPQWAHLPHDLNKVVPPRGNKTQYEEISIPVALLSHRDLQDIFRGCWWPTATGLISRCSPPGFTLWPAPLPMAWASW